METLTDDELLLAHGHLETAVPSASFIAAQIRNPDASLAAQALRLAARHEPGAVSIVSALLQVLGEGGLSRENKCLAVRALVAQASTAHASSSDLEILGCLVPTRDLELLCALYASGAEHTILSSSDDADFLERTLDNASPADCLMLCRAICVVSHGVDTPLALEALLALLKGSPSSMVRAQAAALLWDAISLGHMEHAALTETLPFLLAAPHCAGAVAALVSARGLATLMASNYAEQVLLALLRMRHVHCGGGGGAGRCTGDLSIGAQELIALLLERRLEPALAGNTILFAVEHVAKTERQFANVAVQQLWRVLGCGGCQYFDARACHAMSSR